MDTNFISSHCFEGYKYKEKIVLVYNIYEMNRPSPDDMKAMQVMEYVEELEKENKELKEEIKKWKMIADENGTGYDMMKDEYEKLEKENKELKAQIKKYEDEMMRRFAEINMIHPQSKQMAVLKEFRYSEWYDRVKAEMRREIIGEKEKKEKKKPKAKNAWLIKKIFRERKKGLDELKKK